MTTDKKLKQLIINKLTKEQFDSATVSPNEQYFIKDDDYFATKDDLASKQDKLISLTKEEYEALPVKDPDTYYSITDDTDIPLNILETIYPVGSLYLTVNNSCPLSALGIGTWELVSQDRVLQGAGTRGSAGATVNESLPSHKHTRGNMDIVGAFNIKEGHNKLFGVDATTGAFTSSNAGAICYPNGGADTTGSVDRTFNFKASNNWTGSTSNPDNSIYKDNAHVQQDAYLINVFRRVS